MFFIFIDLKNIGIPCVIDLLDILEFTYLLQKMIYLYTGEALGESQRVKSVWCPFIFRLCALCGKWKNDEELNHSLYFYEDEIVPMRDTTKLH